MAVTDQTNAARFDWRLIPVIIVAAGGLVAWGAITTRVDHVERGLAEMRQGEAERRTADGRVLERLVAMEVQLLEIRRLLTGRDPASGPGR